MSVNKFKHKQIIFRNKSHSNEANCSKSYKVNEEEKVKNELSHMQPEILSYEIMIECLKIRGISSDVLTSNNIRKVVEKLFYKHITPKPQRLYKSNRTGLILRKMRKEIEKNITTSIDDWEKIIAFSPSKSLLRNKNISSSVSSSSHDSPTCERLKSPISSSSEIKIIKLNKSPISPSKITINIHKTKLETTEEMTQCKKIKLSDKEPSSPDKRESDTKLTDAKKRKAIDWP